MRKDLSKILEAGLRGRTEVKLSHLFKLLGSEASIHVVKLKNFMTINRGDVRRRRHLKNKGVKVRMC